MTSDWSGAESALLILLMLVLLLMLMLMLIPLLKMLLSSRTENWSGLIRLDWFAVNTDENVNSDVDVSTSSSFIHTTKDTLLKRKALAATSK